LGGDRAGDACVDEANVAATECLFADSPEEAIAEMGAGVLGGGQAEGQASSVEAVIGNAGSAKRIEVDNIVGLGAGSVS
jgi:hypothetical protein